jgi:superfamily II DNA helicase RecQ
MTHNVRAASSKESFVLVISPSVTLALTQAAKLQEVGIPALVLTGMATSGERAQQRNTIRNPHRSLGAVFVTPEYVNHVHVRLP